MGHGEHSHQQHGHYQHELAVPPDHRRWAELVLLCLGVVERRMTARLMRPQMLARRPVLSGTFLMLTATGLPLGLFFLTSLYFQHARGIGALQTGLICRSPASATTTERLGRPERIRSCRSPSCSIQG
jgi:hypothetical protein